jgi:hypothetical protein
MKSMKGLRQSFSFSYISTSRGVLSIDRLRVVLGCLGPEA